MVSGGKLWWADDESGQLGTVTKRDGRNPVILRNKTSGVVHMKVFDREGQKGKPTNSHQDIVEKKKQRDTHCLLMLPHCLPFAGSA